MLDFEFMPGFLRQMLSAFPSTRSESTVLPTASVRQSPLLLTFVTRFLYLWELWKNHGINSSTWEVASLGVNQSYGEGGEDSLTASACVMHGLASLACHLPLQGSL